MEFSFAKDLTHSSAETPRRPQQNRAPGRNPAAHSRESGSRMAPQPLTNQDFGLLPRRPAAAATNLAAGAGATPIHPDDPAYDPIKPAEVARRLALSKKRLYNPRDAKWDFETDI